MIVKCVTDIRTRGYSTSPCRIGKSALPVLKILCRQTWDYQVQLVIPVYCCPDPPEGLDLA